ncbi:hypothetical protein VTJ83DRAFT_2900 [Remersonia thermophila]|uniref:Uncharacterized protein n=1 Tax=Remersonia thermophila TaxID=72144 RepID=A0ABR4DDG7_9PEZI
MVNIFEDPFAYDGSDFNPFLGHEQFASPPSPEDFHAVTSATESSFPAAIHHALKNPLHHPGYLSPTDPLGPSAPFDDASLRAAAHLPRSVPSGFQHGPGPRGLTIDTANLGWNAAAISTTNVASPIITSPTAIIPTTRPSSHPLYPTAAFSIPATTSSLTATAATTAAAPANPLLSAAAAAAAAAATTTTTNPGTSGPIPDNPDDLAKLVTTLRNELSETRLQLSTVRNELYAARQIEKRLRVERDEARSQAEFLGQERAKLKVTEQRLRRERNEARLAAAQAAAAAAAGLGSKGARVGGLGLGLGGGGKRGPAGLGGAGAGAGAGAAAGTGAGTGAAGGAAGGPAAVASMAGVDSQGEESGESPPMAMDQS